MEIWRSNMEYRKFRISWQEYPDRLYRIFAIRSDVTLDRMAEVILKLFRTDEKPSYVFFDAERCYTTDRLVYMNPKGDYLQALTNNPDLGEVWENKTAMKDARVADLKEQFNFLYDVDDGYRFTCEACGEPFVEEREDEVFVTEGKGAGLFEEDEYTLWSYIDGAVDPGMSEDNEEKGFYMPENLELEKIGDFDRPLDLQEETAIAAQVFDEE